MNEEPTGAVPARVILRPIGSPLSLGLAGLAIASLVQSGFDLHWIARSQSAKVGLALLAVPFFLQFLAAILSYLARDGATGTALGVLAASWLAIALIHLSSGNAHRSGALGLMLLASSGVLALATVAAIAVKPLPTALFVIEAARFACAGVYELGASHPWAQAAGIMGLVVSGVAGYCVLAFDLEGLYHRAVLPTFRRGRARDALAGSAAAAVDDVVHEPGVRQIT